MITEPQRYWKTNKYASHMLLNMIFNRKLPYLDIFAGEAARVST